MEWFLIRPNALANLALAMISVVSTLYLLSVRNKSRDGWLVLGLSAVLSLFFLSSTIREVARGAPFEKYIAGWPQMNIALLAMYLGWFAYAYRRNPFRREMYLAVAIGTCVTVFAFFFPASPSLVWSVGIPGCLWDTIVLLRKSLWAEREPTNRGEIEHTGPAVSWLSGLLHPVTQDGRAYRAFAGWYFYFFWLSVVFTLMIYRILPYAAWEVIVHVQFLTLVTWLVINYLNYSNEPTTFLVKLVGLFLCLTMIILGLVGFLLFRLDTDYRLIQREFRILALLIIGATAVVVTIFPVLFRSNLLQPLQKVVDGIKRVNNGELRVAVNVQVQDEIGYLAASFNQMTDSLRQYSEEMESLVSKRTVELQQQQEELLATLEQLRTAQEQLKRLDVRKTRFFDNITHEFRTPLTLILAPAEHLLRSVAPTSPQFPYLLSVERNARQLMRLINQLLDLSRLEAASLPVTQTRGNITQFTGQIMEAFRPAAEQKGIRLTCQATHVSREHLFDAEKWEKIVGNLLTNALKFTPSGGDIRVEVQLSESDAIKLEVVDTGIGITLDKLPHIFDRFYQADDSRTRAYDGSGIGLSLVKELTQLLGGTVDVESTVGKGTFFTVRLPLTPATGRESAQLAIPLLPEMAPFALTGAGNRDGAKPLLLLVEDNTEMVAFLSQTLRVNYRVATAPNGREGLVVAQRELPDVVISDVMMPEMDGYAFCEALKNDPLTGHIAVLLLTARASQESRLEGLGHKADDYLTKPFLLEELQLRLRNLLDRQEKLRQHYQQQWAGPESVFPPQPVPDVFLSNLYQTIETHLDDSDFDPEALASGVSMSVRTLNRKLNALTGMSAARLIRLYRLKRAVQLLQAGHSVSDTAYQVGFDNPSYFATAFKEHYHKTPSEYVPL